MKYSQLSDIQYSTDTYSIVPIREADMMAIKQWRNDQMEVLRQSRPLSDEDQLRYYNGPIRASFEQEQPRIMLFSYLLDHQLIGYGGLTNIDWENKRAEISYLLETGRSKESNRRQYSDDFSSFLALMKRIAFEELSFNRLFTETFDIRPLHIEVLENNGFRFEGRMRLHVQIHGQYIDSLIHGCLHEEYDHVQR